MHSSMSNRTVMNTNKSTTGGKSRATFKTLHESILTRKLGIMTKQKVFCVLLDQDPHFYFIDFTSLQDDNPNFVNPYENVRDNTETVHNSFYQSFMDECESRASSAYIPEQYMQATLLPGWSKINLKEARID